MSRRRSGVASLARLALAAPFLAAAIAAATPASASRSVPPVQTISLSASWKATSATEGRVTITWSGIPAGSISDGFVVLNDTGNLDTSGWFPGVLSWACPSNSCSTADSVGVDWLVQVQGGTSGTYSFTTQVPTTHHWWVEIWVYGRDGQTNWNSISNIVDFPAAGTSGGGGSGGGSGGGGTGGGTPTNLKHTAFGWCCADSGAKPTWSNDKGSLSLAWTNPTNFCPTYLDVGTEMGNDGILFFGWLSSDLWSSCPTSYTLTKSAYEQKGRTWNDVVGGRALFQVQWACNMPFGSAAPCGSPPLDGYSAVLNSAAVQIASAQPMIGKAGSVTGTVEVEQADGSWRAVKSGDDVHFGDHVRTGPNGHLHLSLRDDTVFSVGPNGDIVLDDFVYDPSANTGTIAAKLAKGFFRWITGHMKLGDKKVTDPVGTIGVRGTDFVLDYDPSTKITTLAVHKGTVVFTPNAGGRPTTIPAGRTARIDARGKATVAPLTASAWAAALARA